jgi:hypothetical protein
MRDMASPLQVISADVEAVVDLYTCTGLVLHTGTNDAQHRISQVLFSLFSLK